MSAAPPRRLLLAALALGGCTIIDRRTVRRSAPPPPPAAGGQNVAILSLRLGDGPPDRAAVAAAADFARARNADTRFEVIAAMPAPAGADPARLRQARDDTGAVAEALAAAGVPRERIDLGLREDPAAAPREVRVYAR
jgi:hypothetical protein